MNRVQALNFHQDGIAKKITVSSTATQTFIGGANNLDRTLYLWNRGAEIVFIRQGGVDDEAVVDQHLALPPGFFGVIGAPNDKGAYVSVVCEAGKSSVIHVTPGRGS